MLAKTTEAAMLCGATGNDIMVLMAILLAPQLNGLPKDEAQQVVLSIVEKAMMTVYEGDVEGVPEEMADYAQKVATRFQSMSNAPQN